MRSLSSEASLDLFLSLLMEIFECVKVKLMLCFITFVDFRSRSLTAVTTKVRDRRLNETLAKENDRFL